MFLLRADIDISENESLLLSLHVFALQESFFSPVLKLS